LEGAIGAGLTMGTFSGFMLAICTFTGAIPLATRTEFVIALTARTTFTLAIFTARGTGAVKLATWRTLTVAETTLTTGTLFAASPLIVSLSLITAHILIGRCTCPIGCEIETEVLIVLCVAHVASLL
jgi:hypothetical protein